MVKRNAVSALFTESHMEKGKRYKSLYLPAWSIVAAVLTLLVVIAISTYRNMSRERGRMEESLIREGLVIIRAVEASVRADFPSVSPDADRLRKLVAEVSREPEVASIIIFAHEGVVVAASPSASPADGTVREASSLQVLLQEKGMVTRYRQLPKGERVFEVIQPFRPYPVPLLRDARTVAAKGTLRQWSEDKVIALSLRLATAETARRQDRHHTLLMAAILVVLGTGALYFVFIVQNYYLVDRTLGRMQSYTENVVESMADGLLSIDRDGRIVTFNRQAGEIFGAGPGTLEGRNINDVLGGAWDETLDPAGGGMVVREKQMDIRRRGRDGKIPISVSVAPLRDEAGQDQGRVLLIKDLREIRDLEEKVRRSERLASLGRLAAGVAHEIRNPLSSIKGFAQYFAKRFKGQEEEEGYAAVMVKEVDRLNRVITELLDFAGPKEPRREPHSLEHIAEHA
jgi:two-component system sensor histidine kinase HydH